MADGSVVVTPWWRAAASIGTLAQALVLVIELGDEPIVGRAVTNLYTLTLDHGRQLIVEP